MAEVLSDRRALAQDRERPPPIAILLHRSAPSISMRVQNCELATTHSWMTLFLSHRSHTADLVRCLLRAISRATDQCFMLRANIVSPGPGFQALPSNIEKGRVLQRSRNFPGLASQTGNALDQASLPLL